MTVTEFYEQIQTLTIHAPTLELAEAALHLQVAIDNLTRDEYDDLHELFV